MVNFRRIPPSNNSYQVFNMKPVHVHVLPPIVKIRGQGGGRQTTETSFAYRGKYSFRSGAYRFPFIFLGCLFGIRVLFLHHVLIARAPLGRFPQTWHRRTRANSRRRVRYIGLQTSLTRSQSPYSCLWCWCVLTAAGLSICLCFLPCERTRSKYGMYQAGLPHVRLYYYSNTCLQ